VTSAVQTVSLTLKGPMSSLKYFQRFVVYNGKKMLYYHFVKKNKTIHYYKIQAENN
jgi:hypothetical protein